jgi:hypothetical protein
MCLLRTETIIIKSYLSERDDDRFLQFFLFGEMSSHSTCSCMDARDGFRYTAFKPLSLSETLIGDTVGRQNECDGDDAGAMCDW